MGSVKKGGQKKDGGFYPPYLAGIFGYNISYSLSPLIHNYISKLLDTNLCYGKFDVTPEKFIDAFNGFKALGIKGANITQPYKTKVLELVDSLSAEAKTIGAVNTVNLEKDGSYCGYNTDIEGFIKAVNYEFKLDLNGKRVMLLGAGGASRAVLYALIKVGVENVLVINRSLNNAEKLKKEADLWKKILRTRSEILYSNFNLTAFSKDILLNGCDIIINTITPSEESGELINKLINNLFENLKNFRNKLFLFDISYASNSSVFLNIFDKRTVRYANGLSMLLFQAIESHYIWTGKRVDFNSVKNVFSDIF